MSIPSRVFGALSSLWRSPAKRRFALPLIGTLAIGFLAGLPAAALPVHVSSVPVASGGWLNRLNQWRASTGLPSLTENTLWSQGDYNHALYMVKNNLVTHYETPGVPYYTTAGDIAAQNGNIEVSSTTSATDEHAIEWWMAAPFHAMNMMDPRLAQTGFGSYRDSTTSPWQAGFTLDTIRGNSFSGGQYPVYFPGNGTTEPLTSYGGGEFPDPLSICSGYSAPTGLPVFIQVGGNINTTVGPVHTFTGNGVPLNHCVFDSTATSVHSYLYTRGGVILVPQRPLQAGVKYVVALTVNGVPYTWSFKVGAFFGVTGVSPTTGAALGGTTVTISGSGFSNGTTSVMFGTTPGASFSVLNDTTITAVTPAHAVGTVDVTVTNAQGTTLVSPLDQFTFACATASLAPASGTFPAGSVINFTASSTGCAAPQYEFWVEDPSGTWTLMQGFGGPTFSWSTGGLATGTYVVHAWVNAQGTGHDAIGEAIITLTGCTSAAVNPPTATQPAGSIVAMTARSSGCANPRYEFWVQYPNGTWNLKQGFGGPTFNWSTTGLAPGTYTVHAWVNTSGTGHDAIGEAIVTLTGCTSASVNPPAATQPAGTTIRLTASSGGCPMPVYEFFVQYPDGTWYLKQGWGGPGFNWDTTGLAPGTYTVHAWVSAAGAGHDAIAEAIITLTGCTSAAVNPPTATQPAGTNISMTASSGGCPAPVYEFFVQSPDGTWNLKQGFGGPSFSWDTTGLAPGTYTVHAWVSAAGAGHDAIGEAIITLTGCTSAAVNPPTATQPAGTTVSLMASSGGCLNPVYEFWVQYPDSSWHLVRGFGVASAIWDTSGLRPGIYTIHAWANQQGAAPTLEVYGSSAVTLTGCTSAALTPASGSVATGSAVSFVAISTGCPSPVYEFWLQYPDGTWHLMRGFGAGTWQWTTLGLASGSYVIHVWANNLGGDTATYETIGEALFTLT